LRVLLFVGPLARGEDAVAVTIVAPLSASVGETFMVDLVLGAVQGLDAAEFSVSYDATILALSNVLLRDGGGREIPTVVGPPVVVDVGVAPAFDKRADWVFDPPGGSGDGVASPGERVYPRIRLKNVGTADIRGVRVHFTRNTPVRMPPGWRRSTTRGLWVGRTTANR
jgi:hypothetical protein